MESPQNPSTSTDFFITYLPIVTLVLGAILGFISSLIKDYISDRKKNKKEENELALKRLEEIFIGIDKINDFTLKTIPRVLSNKDTSNIDIKSAKTSFLIRAYFISLDDEYKKYLKISSDLGTIFTKIALKEKNFDNDSNEITLKYNEQLVKLYNLIIEETKKYM